MTNAYLKEAFRSFNSPKLIFVNEQQYFEIKMYSDSKPHLELNSLSATAEQ